MRVVVAIALIALGGLLLYAGDQDDSPGLGGIGLLLIIGTIGAAVQRRRRS